MARVIPFSTQFPTYHPRAGEKTYFVEKVLNELKIEYRNVFYMQMLVRLNPGKPLALLEAFYKSLRMNISTVKPHTIRAGNRWNAGDMFSPRVWSGKPYNSPQIQFADDTLIERQWGICKCDAIWDIDSEVGIDLNEIATNDGLALEDFNAWFTRPFDGQIICWSKNVNY